MVKICSKILFKKKVPQNKMFSTCNYIIILLLEKKCVFLFLSDLSLRKLYTLEMLSGINYSII